MPQLEWNRNAETRVRAHSGCQALTPYNRRPHTAKYSIQEVASTVCIQHKIIRLFNEREVESTQIVYTMWCPHSKAARQEFSRETMSETSNQASIGSGPRKANVLQAGSRFVITWTSCTMIAPKSTTEQKIRLVEIRMIWLFGKDGVGRGEDRWHVKRSDDFSCKHVRIHCLRSGYAAVPRNSVRKKCNAAGLVAEDALKLQLLADLPSQTREQEKDNVAPKHKNPETQ